MRGTLTRSFIKSLFLFILLMQGSGFVAAETIPNGSEVIGTISVDGEADTHQFGGIAGQSGIISVSGNISSGEHFEVYNPDGTRLGGGSSAELITLTQTGVHSVVVTSFQARGTGNYTLSVEMESLPFSYVALGDSYSSGEGALPFMGEYGVDWGIGTSVEIPFTFMSKIVLFSL